MNTLINLDDQELYLMCQQYGAQALEARRKFIGLLPEVNRRKLYETKGFSSIFQFAAMLAGVSEEQVRTVINRERQFKHIPEMKKVLVNGEVSLSKINAVASIVTPENAQEVVHRAINLSRGALETWVRDVKRESQLLPGDVNPQQSPLIVKEPNLSQEIKQKLVELEEKGIDINELIAQALERRECEIADEKEQLAEKAQQKLIQQITQEKRVSRHTPVATKRLLKKEFGTKCAIAGCRNMAVEIHHTNRFGISHDHNPYYLAPLCKAHHELAGLIDFRAMQKRKEAIRKQRENIQPKINGTPVTVKT